MFMLKKQSFVDFLQSVQHKCNPVIVLIQYFLIGLLDYGKNNNQYCKDDYLTQLRVGHTTKTLSE